MLLGGFATILRIIVAVARGRVRESVADSGEELTEIAAAAAAVAAGTAEVDPRFQVAT